MFAPLAVFAIVGIQGLFEKEEEQPWQWFGVHGFGAAMIAVVLFHSTIRLGVEVGNWATYVAGLKDKVAFRYGFGSPGPEFEVIEHIRHHKKPGERIAVMGWNAAIQYESGLQAASRHFYSLPFWMAEFMKDLKARPPEHVVVSTTQAARLVGRQVSMEEFPEFHAFITDGYEESTRIDDFIVYHLR
jgi:hypothetical protein